MITAGASCKQDPATSSSTVNGLANPRPTPATPIPVAPVAPTTPLTMNVNGLALAPRTALAATRGGEVVHVELSTTAGRTCDELFGHDGISLGSDEVLVSLDLARPIAGDRDATGQTPPPGSMPLQVTHASWPSGQSGLQHGATADDLVIPADFAAHGGKMKVRYAGDFVVGAGGPKVALRLDGEVAVTSCGDRGPAPIPPVQPITVTNGTRTLPIRGALITHDDQGAWTLELSSLPRRCGKDGGDGDPGDLAIELHHRDPGPFLDVYGDLAPIQQNYSLADYKDVTLAASGDVNGTAPIRVAVTVAIDHFPLALHGEVTATPCP